jgi:hypothetical protein|tara:strand:- start:3252 stop:3563 length:312 start_codon:yes stop_codon:yes gene_type:complete
MGDVKTQHKCPACAHGTESKKASFGLSTGPDQLHGGDGLPDWMQFTITVGMFGILYWVLMLLFHPVLELDPNHRDLLNIILGTFIATFGKTIDFWFRHSKKKE